ncbi:hypothetical protein AMTRI_Chr03g54720 [Amborella trichopoda]
MFKNLDWWFDSYLWVTDGGKIEAKYTSRAAELYRQLFSKEVAKSLTDDLSSPRSPLASQANQTVNGLSHVADKHEAPKVTTSPNAPSHPVTGTIKMPIGARKGSMTGGLGAQKLTTKVELFFSLQ